MKNEDGFTNNHTNPVDQFTEGYPLQGAHLQGNTKTVSKKRGHRRRRVLFSEILRNVTVEPTMCLFVLSAIIMMIASQNLSLEKACRVDLKLPDDICKSLKLQEVESQNENEKQVQRLLTKYIASRTYLTATVPCIMALLAGTWSDQTGHRKILIIIPIIGQILCNINNMINVYFFNELSLKYLIFGEAFFEAFSGGWCMGFFSMFAYISTITSAETRTFRIGIVNFGLTVGFPIGMGVSGILLKKTGYYGCYGLSASIHLVNLLYTIFYLRDPPRTPEQKQHDNKGARHFFRTFFNLTNIKDTIQVVFKNGPNNRRLQMCVMMVVVCILFGPLFGEISIMYMNTRYRFKWNEVKFSIFQTYNFVTHTVGTIFSITVFSKFLQWHDSILGVISTVSKIAASFIYCFAPTATIFYIAPLVEILNGTSLLAIRSIVSKLVAPDELGKVNSLIGLTENLMPLLFVPLYTSVYNATIDVLPGAVFLMGAALTLPAVLVFIWLLFEHLNSKRRMRIEKREDNSKTRELVVTVRPLVDKVCM